MVTLRIVVYSIAIKLLKKLLPNKIVLLFTNHKAFEMQVLEDKSSGEQHFWVYHQVLVTVLS